MGSDCILFFCCCFLYPAQSPCKNKNKRAYLWPFFFLCLSIHFFCSCMMEPLLMLYIACAAVGCMYSHYSIFKTSFSLLTSHLLSCNACFIANGISCSKFYKKSFWPHVFFSFVLNADIVKVFPQASIL